MNAVSEKIMSIGVVPVIKLNNPERDSVDLAKALVASSAVINLALLGFFKYAGFISKIINYIVESESDEELLDNLSGVQYLL